MIPFGDTDDCQSDTCISGSGFYDSLTRLEPSVLFRITYHLYGNAVLDASCGVESLDLCEDGMSVYYHANPDRGYTSGSVSFPRNNELDVEKIETMICADCFNKIYEEAWSNSPYSVGVIDFSNMEVRLFEEDITGFTFGDYYVDLDYRKLEDEDERIDINILAFYCPQRYE